MHVQPLVIRSEAAWALLDAAWAHEASTVLALQAWAGTGDDELHRHHIA
jgi:hypothetical protein